MKRSKGVQQLGTAIPFEHQPTGVNNPCYTCLPLGRTVQPCFIQIPQKFALHNQQLLAVTQPTSLPASCPRDPGRPRSMAHCSP